MVADVWVEKMETAKYPDYPFSPSQCYPELSKLPYSVGVASIENEVYASVRNILYNLQLDAEHYGTAEWNPLGRLVQPNKKVVIKPNFVRGTHIYGEEGVLGMITHASLIRPMIDYVLLATKGNAEIIVGDAPIRTSDWSKIVIHSRIGELIQFYRENGITIHLIDFRKDLAVNNKHQVFEATTPNPSRIDSKYLLVDMHQESMLCDIMHSRDRFDMGGIKFGTIKKHHDDNHNLYLLPEEILQADFVINMPKMKSHRMAGLTCAMKNLIGINGDKSYIAHFRRGVKSSKSDEFEKFSVRIFLRERIWNGLKALNMKITRSIMTLGKRFVVRFIWKGRSFEEVYASSPPKLYREGGWEGNDTLWRCVVDLNRIIKYADKSGKMTDEEQREVLCIADAVVAGEGEGPLATTPKPIGVIFGGHNSVYVDYTAAKIMGFNYRKMPMISQSFNKHRYPITDKKPEELLLSSNVSPDGYTFDFVPTSGWKTLKDL